MAEGSRTLLIAGSREGIRRAAGELEAFAAANQLPAAVIWPFQVVLDEMLSNIVHHGYEGRPGGRIEVELRLEGGVLQLTVLDDAPPFDPLEAPEPDTTLPVEQRPLGGLGIFLVRKLMDEVQYERRDGRNRVACRKRIPA
jgi:anti-sigma regulatory factor (Ser/Thr protein kinase)